TADRLVENLALACERLQRAVLVGSGEAGKAFHVGGKDRRQPALHLNRVGQNSPCNPEYLAPRKMRRLQLDDVDLDQTVQDGLSDAKIRGDLSVAGAAVPDF